MEKDFQGKRDTGVDEVSELLVGVVSEGSNEDIQKTVEKIVNGAQEADFSIFEDSRETVKKLAQVGLYVTSKIPEIKPQDKRGIVNALDAAIMQINQLTVAIIMSDKTIGQLATQLKIPKDQIVEIRQIINDTYLKLHHKVADIHAAAQAEDEEKKNDKTHDVSIEGQGGEGPV